MSDYTVSSGFGLCDFCSPPSPAKWMYACSDFVMVGGITTLNSKGPWAACVTCAELIEAHSTYDLAMRILGDELDSALRDALRAQQVRILEKFFSHSTGERALTNTDSFFAGEALFTRKDPRNE